MIEKIPTVEFVALTKDDNHHHVMIVHDDTPEWYLLIATFPTKGRAMDYADFENQFSDDTDMVDRHGDTNPAPIDTIRGAPPKRDLASVVEDAVRRALSGLAVISSLPAGRPAPVLAAPVAATNRVLSGAQRDEINRMFMAGARPAEVATSFGHLVTYEQAKRMARTLRDKLERDVEKITLPAPEEASVELAREVRELPPAPASTPPAAPVPPPTPTPVPMSPTTPAPSVHKIAVQPTKPEPDVRTTALQSPAPMEMPPVGTTGPQPEPGPKPATTATPTTKRTVMPPSGAHITLWKVISDRIRDYKMPALFNYALVKRCADHLKIPSGSIGSHLTRLRKEGLIEAKGEGIYILIEIAPPSPASAVAVATPAPPPASPAALKPAPDWLAPALSPPATKATPTKENPFMGKGQQQALDVKSRLGARMTRPIKRHCEKCGIIFLADYENEMKCARCEG